MVVGSPCSRVCDQIWGRQLCLLFSIHDFFYPPFSMPFFSPPSLSCSLPPYLSSSLRLFLPSSRQVFFLFFPFSSYSVSLTLIPFLWFLSFSFSLCLPLSFSLPSFPRPVLVFFSLFLSLSLSLTLSLSHSLTHSLTHTHTHSLSLSLSLSLVSFPHLPIAPLPPLLPLLSLRSIVWLDKMHWVGKSDTSKQN